MGIFKAYDIRGIYPSELDENKARSIGQAYAEILKKELKKEDITIVVGRDMRLSSPSLSKALIEGITSQGVNVKEIGLASTPTFYFAVAHYGYDGGMQVSASHNPKEYNGLKIVKAKAYPVGEDTGMKDIEMLAVKGSFKPSQKKGKVSALGGVLEAEVDAALRHADLSKIRGFKVVADAANSMGSPYLELLFSKLDCELVKMNFELDGTFPAHQADPFKDENVAELKKKVVEESAGLGIATDGDGDRIFFIDNKGNMVEPAIIRGIMAKIVLRSNPGAKILFDVRPGRITRDMIVESGGIPGITRVGHSLIKAQAIKEGAVFAGESSGHFFMKTEDGFFETPMIVALNLLEEMALQHKSSYDLVQPLRKYFHSGEINIKSENKQGIMALLKKKYFDAKITEIDGFSAEYKEWWFNVRASNTEPLIRLNLEAVSKEAMEKRRDEVLALIKSC